VVVVKCRLLLIWTSVRIHLDEVEDVESFVELEAMAAACSDVRLEYRQVDQISQPPRPGLSARNLRQLMRYERRRRSRTNSVCECHRLSTARK
jgi:adenylate cyclase class IV